MCKAIYQTIFSLDYLVDNSGKEYIEQILDNLNDDTLSFR